MPRKQLETEWHNYKSGHTGKVSGAYCYLPSLSDENLAHVYQPRDASGWYVCYFIAGMADRNGYIAPSLDVAKARAASAIVQDTRGQKDLFVHAPF